MRVYCRTRNSSLNFSEKSELKYLKSLMFFDLVVRYKRDTKGGKKSISSFFVSSSVHD